jgi:DNA polymerase-3 subunit epsilon
VPPETNPDADPNHPYYGRMIAFTGTLMTMTRPMAWIEVARLGGIPENGVTRHTNVLVIGDINHAVLSPGMETTGRVAKGFALRAKRVRHRVAVRG